ncbi:hypothetical protein ACIRJO_02895 [Streptomyces sp. NPDC102394]|uniref:hypothetical protein n=1 Tax=Streptomyces sp. NPDC102394 TaxID=3366167 RepID=UPI003806D078
MPLPAGVETVTVSSGQPLTLPDGTAIEGTLYFSGPDVVTIAGEDVLLGGEVPPVELVGGEFSVALVATDASGMSPTGWTYTVRAVLTNAPSWIRYISLPKATANVALADVVVPDPVAGSYSTLIDANAVAAAYLAKSQNLADLPDKAAARTSLELGGASVLEVGTSADTVAAGDDPRFGQSNPWVFDITAAAYGAKGDGKVVTDGAMSSGSTTLTSATAAFTAGDQDKVILVKGAGPAGVTTLVTTISTVDSPTSVTLAAANASGGDVTGALVMWGTDDTAAIQAAIDAAGTYATAHGAATVRVPVAPSGRFYAVAGALVSGGSTHGNAQLTIPVIATTDSKAILTFEGETDAAAVQHWEQTVPQTSGSTLVSFRVFSSSSAQIASINAAGNACVLGGPSQPGGYGVAPGVFSNMHVAIKGLSILTTHSAFGLTLSALDLSGVANASLQDFAYGTCGSVAGGDYGSPGSFANGLCPGLLMPASGNNDLVLIRNTTCLGGYTYGAFVTEHAVCDMRILYCWSAFCPVGTYYSSVGSTHAIVAPLLSIEACTYLVYIIGGGSGGIGPFIHLRIDTETGLPRFGDNNSGFASSTARGDVVLTGLYEPANLVLDNPVGYDLVDGQRSFPGIAVSADYTVSAFDEVVTVDASAAPCTVTLPTAVGRNKRVVVAKSDGSGNVVTVAAAGGQTINGAATTTLATPWAAAECLPAAGNWIAI